MVREAAERFEYGGISKIWMRIYASEVKLCATSWRSACDTYFSEPSQAKTGYPSLTNRLTSKNDVSTWMKTGDESSVKNTS